MTTRHCALSLQLLRGKDDAQLEGLPEATRRWCKDSVGLSPAAVAACIIVTDPTLMGSAGTACTKDSLGASTAAAEVSPSCSGGNANALYLHLPLPPR